MGLFTVFCLAGIEIRSVEEILCLNTDLQNTLLRSKNGQTKLCLSERDEEALSVLCQ